MTQSDTITVNGQIYYVKTGLPVDSSTKSAAPVVDTEAVEDKTPPTKAQRTASSDIHLAGPQRAATAGRVIRKPAQVRPPEAAPATPDTDRQPTPAVNNRPKTARAFDITPHPKIKKFNASTPGSETEAPVVQPTKPVNPDIAPRQHPHVLRAQQKMIQQKQQQRQQAQVTAPSPQQTKEAEIAKAIASTDEAKPEKPKRTKKTRSKRTRTLQIVSAIALILIALAAVVWISLPALSVKVASIQSGINATAPHFVPDGYTLRVPVNADENRITMTFSSNQNDSSFIISQEKSTWDSEAVRIMVEGRSNGQFLITQDRGLTVFTHNGNAAWVNGGLLYQISGDARLSNDTIMKIVASL